MTAQPHILIVDDDAEIRDLLARFLRKHGFRADTARDGKSMDTTLQNGRFDLVVLDSVYKEVDAGLGVDVRDARGALR